MELVECMLAVSGTRMGFCVLQKSMEVLEVALGTAPPMFGLQGSYWSTEGNQVNVFISSGWTWTWMDLLGIFG